MKSLLILLLLLPLGLRAQQKQATDQQPAENGAASFKALAPTNESIAAAMSQAGKELTRYYKVHSIGTAIAVSGGVICLAGVSVG
jgi:hypothetical protein